MPYKKVLRKRRGRLKLDCAKTLTGAKWCRPSKLEPYKQLIQELLKKNWPLEKIRTILKDEFKTEIALSSLHNFIKVRIIYN
jgi:transposase